MQKQNIETKKAPVPVGPYSQAVKYGDLVFCAGQIGGGDDIKEQTKQAFENLKNVLEAAGSSLKSVLKVNVYLKNMSDFSAMNEVYATYLKEPYPARATVEVVALPKGALIEIECVAYSIKEEDCCENCNCGSK